MENKLPEDFKKQWIAALRSGQYQQGQFYLENEGTFCCLGVACKILGVKTENFDDEDGASYPKETIPRDETLVPEILRDDHEIAWTLARMNDGQGDWAGRRMSFAEIADYIEQNL